MQAMTYELLSEHDRVEIIEARLKQLESEHFQQGLNRRSLDLATDVDEHTKAQQLAEIDTAIGSLEAAIQLHRAERAQLVNGAARPL